MAKKIFLILNFLILVLYLVGRIYISNNLIFKKSVISKKEFNNIISEKKEYKKDIEIKLDNEIIPYDKTKDYYLLSQVKDTKYNGNLSIDKFNIKILRPTKTKKELIASSKSLVVLAYNKKYYKIINLKLTDFPVIKLDNNTNQVIMYDNTSERKVLNVMKEYMTYSIRGAYSAKQEKKSYKLNIVDSSGNKKDVSFLNMRKDDDWILNSMNNDKSYMKEKIGYHLWGTLDDYNLEMKYVELFIDNEYKGVYCLQEPADLKTYNANDDSVLIQIKRRKDEKDNSTLFSKNLKYNENIDEFEIDSKLEESKQVDIIRSFVIDVKEFDYKKKINLEYDLENITDYSLFINLISAVDNTYKNQKVLFRNIEEDYFVEIYPWDLDWTHNNENLKHRVDFFQILENGSVPLNIAKSDKYNLLIKEKYFNLRKRIYNQEYIFNLIDSYKNELDSSGAIFREKSIWGRRNLDNSVANLKDFYTQRIKQLDTYFEVKNGI